MSGVVRGEDEPLVSILIPCWGCETFIEEAISSALSQTYERIEVRVVEDAGTDETYARALRFRDDRLVVLRNERNVGQFENKNRCLRGARGLLLKYLDGDDVLRPNCVESLVAAWRSVGGEVGLVLGQFDVIDSRGRTLSKPRSWGVSGRRNGRRVLSAVMRREEPGSPFGNFSPHLVDRSTLKRVGGFPNDHSWAGDWETFFKLLVEGDVLFLEDEVASYRMQESSVGRTMSPLRSIEDDLAMIDRLVSYAKARRWMPESLDGDADLREWKVWQSSDRILSQWYRKMRGLPNVFAEIEGVYARVGLESDLGGYIRRKAVPYMVGTGIRKLKRRLGARDGGSRFMEGDLAGEGWRMGVAG